MVMRRLSLDTKCCSSTPVPAKGTTFLKTLRREPRPVPLRSW
ncbi:hypothetical protein CRUP_029169 [Coryphaenoides rupestris]|nr:hypothetical protein CRUP_029169 [Coryphaenoides rupestris]